MRQPNGSCSTPARKSSAAKQCIKELAHTHEEAKKTLQPSSVIEMAWVSSFAARPAQS